jgi:hypothetical protein
MKVLQLLLVPAVLAVGCASSTPTHKTTPDQSQSTTEEVPAQTGPEETPPSHEIAVPVDPGSLLYREIAEKNMKPGTFDLDLTVHESGKWVETTPHGTRQGVLDAEQLQTIRLQINKTKLVATMPHATCAAIPNHNISVTANKRTASFPDMCGAIPDPSIAELQKLVRSMLPAMMTLGVWHNLMPRTVGTPAPDNYIVFQKGQFPSEPKALVLGGTRFPGGWGGIRNVPTIKSPVMATLELADGTRLPVKLTRDEAH